MIYKKILTAVIMIFYAVALNADNKSIQLSAFLDTYLAYDNNSFVSRERPYFTQSRYEDSLGVNLAYLDAKYDQDNFRSRLAFQAGHSVDSNYANEPHEFWKYVQEAVVGYKINDKIWIDAGVFLSHIGFESWISKDNWNYTRSFVAEFSPYYQSGAKVSYQASENLQTQIHLLNGWQNTSDERHPALGTQLKWQAFDDLSLTHNTFLGEEIGGTRFFNDVIAIWNASDLLSFALAYDIGLQQQSSGDQVSWNGYSLQNRYKLSEKLSIGSRFERYSDPKQLIVSTAVNSGFQAYGASINFDFFLSEHMLLRAEYRHIKADSDVFVTRDSASDQDKLLVSSITFTY